MLVCMSFNSGSGQKEPLETQKKQIFARAPCYDSRRNYMNNNQKITSLVPNAPDCGGGFLNAT